MHFRSDFVKCKLKSFALLLCLLSYCASYEEVSIDVCARDYRVYNDIWEASVGEELPCQHEDEHAADPYDILECHELVDSSDEETSV